MIILTTSNKPSLYFESTTWSLTLPNAPSALPRVSSWVIWSPNKANPRQIKAVENIQSPQSVKDVQKLTGCLTALNKFISRYSDKSRSFFDTLQKGRQIKWTSECESALADLKLYFSSAPLLFKLKSGEILLLYLSVFANSLRAVLVREEEVQKHPIYYVSKSMLDAELRYPQLEKLALALVMASRKLKSWFQSHLITIVTAFHWKLFYQSPIFQVIWPNERSNSANMV